MQLVTAPAMAWTLLWSMGEAMAKPASMMSTPSFSSCFAISIFSGRFMLQPGDCSPSLRVVSKILMRFMSLPPCRLIDQINIKTGKTKWPSSPLHQETKAMNFRGTTPLGSFLPTSGISAFPREYRLSGNGEETRFHLNNTSQRKYSRASDILPLCIASHRPATLWSVLKGLFPCHCICSLFCW